MGPFRPVVKRKQLQLVNLPRTYFEVEDVRLAEGQGQDQMSQAVIWKMLPREINTNVLKFLSGKELGTFKVISKGAESSVKIIKVLLFDAIREQLDDILGPREQLLIQGQELGEDLG